MVGANRVEDFLIFLLVLYAKLWTQKMSPQQVDNDVNKTRRRWSLLAALILYDGRRVMAGRT